MTGFSFSSSSLTPYQSSSTPYPSSSSSGSLNDGAHRSKKRARTEGKVDTSKSDQLALLPESLRKFLFPYLDFNSQLLFSRCSKGMKLTNDDYQKLATVISISERAFGLGKKLNWWNGQVQQINVIGQPQFPVIELENALISLIGKNNKTLKNFEYIGSVHQFSPKEFEALKSCLKLQSFDFNYFHAISVEELKQFLSSCKQLKSMVIPENFTDKHLDVISQSCSGIENLSFYSKKITPKVFVKFTENVKHLRRLELSGIELTVDMMSALNKNCQELESLTIRPCKIMGINVMSHLPSSLISFNLFEHFSISMCTFINFPSLPKLKHMTINYTYSAEDAFHNIFKNVPNLQYLALSARNQQGKIILDLLKGLPLEYLQLDIDDLTDEFCAQLPEVLPNLRFLSLDFRYNQITESRLASFNNYKHLEYLHLGCFVSLGDELINNFQHKLKYFVVNSRQEPKFPVLALKEYGFPT